MELQPAPKSKALITAKLLPPKKKAKSKIGDVSDLCSVEDSPLTKKLKDKISMLRKKWKEDGMKIRCLQNKIRRITRRQGIGKEKRDTLNEQTLKQRRMSSESDSADDSSESLVYFPPSPSAVNRLNIKQQNNIKSELFPTNGNERTKALQTTGTCSVIGLEEYLIETIKAEHEDDPLTFIELNG